MNQLSELFLKITPTELAKMRKKRQDTSTRDKEIFLKKVYEIESVLEEMNIENITFTYKNK